MMTDGITERARELGRLLGQTDEYRALARAQDGLSDDGTAVTAMQRLDELEQEIAAAVRGGMEPSDAVKEEYERLFSELQSASTYQAMVAAQSNFARLMNRVNDEISRGLEAGSQSRIILPS